MGEACLHFLASLAKSSDFLEDSTPMSMSSKPALACLECQKSKAEYLADFTKFALTHFGRTSWLLSGGATFGFYHWGVMKALLEEDLLPNLICGTSMGSMAAIFLASRTNEEALRDLRDIDRGLFKAHNLENGPLQGSKLWKFYRMMWVGYLYEGEDWDRKLSAAFSQGMTFIEAYRKTGRTVNITCTPAKVNNTKLPPMLLNHLTAPHVTLSSAALASSSVPTVLKANALLEKAPDGSQRQFTGLVGEKTGGSLEVIEMRDGFFEADVPVDVMGSCFNSQFSIVSQVNPHIIPFFFWPQGEAGKPYRFSWRGGYLASLFVISLKEHMITIFEVMHKAGLLIEMFGVTWSYIFVQETQGDVTIIPPARLLDWYHILDNTAKKKDLQRYIDQGERSSWKSFAIIKNRMRIQRALEGLEASLAALSRSPSPEVDSGSPLRRSNSWSRQSSSE